MNSSAKSGDKEIGSVNGAAGALPASCLDIKSVGCWPQAVGAWHSYIRLAPGCQLVPELLLNNAAVADSSVPVADAAKPVATAIQKGYGRQFFATLKVPSDAKTGIYVSELKLVAEGRTVGSLRLNVRILPFTLPPPKTRYNMHKPYRVLVARLGECHRALRNRPQALKAYESIANIREANQLQCGCALLATAATWLAPVERGARRTEEELQQARAALERAEACGAVPVADMGKAWLDFARALREAGSLADVAGICRRIAGIERLPANISSEANILLGDCHNDLGEYKMAVYSYEQAVKSNAGIAMRKIAAAARAAGDYSRAQAAYSDLIPLTGEEDMKWVARQLKVMTEVCKPAVEIRPENLNLRPSLDDDELDRLLNGMRA